MLPNRMFFDNFFNDIQPNDIPQFMKCDIYEDGNMCYIEIDAPGFKKEDINIEFDKGNLRVSLSHKKEEKENDSRKYVRRERAQITKCERTFYLGEVAEDDINAEFKDGILKISVPRENNEETSKKIININ